METSAAARRIAEADAETARQSTVVLAEKAAAKARAQRCEKKERNRFSFGSIFGFDCFGLQPSGPAQLGSS